MRQECSLSWKHDSTVWHTVLQKWASPHFFKNLEESPSEQNRKVVSNNTPPGFKGHRFDPFSVPSLYLTIFRATQLNQCGVSTYRQLRTGWSDLIPKLFVQRSSGERHRSGCVKHGGGSWLGTAFQPVVLMLTKLMELWKPKSTIRFFIYHTIPAVASFFSMTANPNTLCALHSAFPFVFPLVSINDYLPFSSQNITKAGVAQDICTVPSIYALFFINLLLQA